MATEPIIEAPLPERTFDPARLLPRGFPRPLRSLRRAYRILGPGLITGAADDDPSGIGTYSQVGAGFGLGQLWLALYLLPLAIAVQEMCGRIGLVTGEGIAGVVRKHYGRPLLFSAVVLLLIANTINIGADLGAMAASVQLLVPQAPGVVVLIGFTLVILALQIFVPYRLYAHILKLLVLSLLAYVITAFLIQPDWGAILRATLIPNIQWTPAFLALVVAVLGTTISPYLFFWQASEEVEEQELHHPHFPELSPNSQHRSLVKQLRSLRVDTTSGMVISLATFWFIVMTTGLTLHPNGITNITSPDQAATALIPLVRGFHNAGQIAGLIFALGIIGTGLLAVPVLAGSAAYGVAEALGWKQGLAQPLHRARGFYGVIAAATLIGMGLNLFGVNPIQALVYAAVINGIIAVPLLVLILRIANDPKVMRDHTNGRWSNGIGILTTVAMGVAALVTVVSLVWR